MKTKKCSTCRIEKPLSEFYKRSDRKIGYRYQCKKCINKYRARTEVKKRNKKYYQKEVVKGKAREYSQRPEVKERVKKYYEMPENRFKKNKSGAEERGHKFEIDYNWYIKNIWNKPCKYCGGKTVNGIDREKNNKEYTKNNSVPCCPKCNYMKNNHSVKEFLSHIKKIANYQLNKEDK